MKLTVLGGGGVRTPFLMKSLALGANHAGLTQLTLMDESETKLQKCGRIARHIAKLCNPGLDVVLTTDAETALTDADYIITTIRGGGDDSRVFDERACIAQGVLGQETTGAGGFAMALRSVPVLSRYCEMAKRLSAPNAVIFNFTNPSGLVTQAMRAQGFGTVYGICDAPSGFFRQLHGLFGYKGTFTGRAYGLNHLSWFDGFTLDGADVTRELLNNPRLYTETEMHLFDPELIRLGGDRLPNEYLFFYYYPERTKAAIAGAAQTRGEIVAQVGRDMDAALSRIDMDKDMDAAFQCFMHYYNIRENSYFSVESGRQRPTRAATLSLREYLAQPDAGGYSAVALNYIRHAHSETPARMVLSLPNCGAIDGLMDNDVVEVSCTIGTGGPVPDRIGAIPPMQMSLIRQVKLYENLAVEAILERSRSKAVKALLSHPLVASYPAAVSLTDAFLAQYAAFTGEWRP